MLNTPSYHWSSIQDKHWTWNGLPWIPICMEVKISIPYDFQVSTWKDKHIISRSSKILENIFYYSLVIKSRVRLEMADHAYNIACVRSGAKYRIHETFWDWSVPIPSYVLNLLKSLGRLLFREVNAMNEWEHSFLRVLYGISRQYFIYIRCLGKFQLYDRFCKICVGLFKLSSFMYYTAE